MRTQNWNGRLYVDPKPEKPNPSGFRSQQGLYPILEPFDLKGVGGLSFRYLDPAKNDDSWLYLPSLRRARRLSTAQRSDALFGQDTDTDSYYGYAGHIAVERPARLGLRRRVGEAPRVRDRGRLEAAAIRILEARHLHRQGVVARSLLGHLRPRGWLWKIWINDWSFRRKAMDGGITYPDEMAFQPAIVMVDMQLEHATKAALPSPRFPGEQGWYFNQGEKPGSRTTGSPSLPWWRRDADRQWRRAGQGPR